MFQCHETKLCIPTDWVCNRILNCGGNDQSDEDIELHRCNALNLQKYFHLASTFSSKFDHSGEEMCKSKYELCGSFFCALIDDGSFECPWESK